jgi:hypothetical protein
MGYFNGIKDKGLFRKLCKQLHPDHNNGQDAEFKAMINEWENIKEDQQATPRAEFNINDQSEEFKKAYYFAIMQDITLNIIGSWLWITPESKTFSIKAGLKQHGFKWASKKKQWYFGIRESQGKKKHLTIDEIKGLYGVAKTVKGKAPKQIM